MQNKFYYETEIFRTKTTSTLTNIEILRHFEIQDGEGLYIIHEKFYKIGIFNWKLSVDVSSTKFSRFPKKPTFCSWFKANRTEKYTI